MTGPTGTVSWEQGRVPIDIPHHPHHHVSLLQEQGRVPCNTCHQGRVPRPPSLHPKGSGTCLHEVPSGACPTPTVLSPHGSRDMSPVTHGTVPPSCRSRDIPPSPVSPWPRPSCGSRDRSPGTCHWDRVPPEEQSSIVSPCPCPMACPPPVHRPDGRGCPARGGPACGQAGGQRVPAPAPGPHLRPGGPAGFGRCHKGGGHDLGQGPPPRGCC